MKGLTVALAVLALVAVVLAGDLHLMGCYRPGGARVHHIASPLPHEYIDAATLPDSYEYAHFFCRWCRLLTCGTTAGAM